MTKDKQNQKKKRWSEIRKNIQEAHPIFEPKEWKEKHIHKFRQANLFSYPIFEDGKEVWVCEDLNCSARELRESKKAPESRGGWEERFREKFVRTSYPFLGGQHDNFKEIDVPTEIFEMELIERIEDFIQSELTLAHTEGIEEVVELAKSLREPDDCGQNPKYPKDQCTPTCGHNNALNKIIIHYQQPKDK